jgi:hypothetical protein
MSASVAIQNEASFANHAPSPLPSSTADGKQPPGAQLSTNDNPFTGAGAERGDAHTRTPRGIGSGFLKLFAKSAASPPPFKIPRPKFDAPAPGGRIRTDISMRPMNEPVAGPSTAGGRPSGRPMEIDSRIHELTENSGSKSSATNSDVEMGTSRPKAGASIAKAEAESMPVKPSAEKLSTPPRSPAVVEAEAVLTKAAKPIYRDKALSTIPEGLTEAEQLAYQAGNKAYNDYIDNATIQLAESINKRFPPREIVSEWKAFNAEGGEMAKQTMMQRYQPGSTEASLHLGNIDYLPEAQQAALKELKAELERGMDNFRQQDTTSLSAFHAYKNQEQGVLDKSIDKANTAVRNVEAQSTDSFRNKTFGVGAFNGTVNMARDTIKDISIVAAGAAGTYFLAKAATEEVAAEKTPEIQSNDDLTRVTEDKPTIEGSAARPESRHMKHHPIAVA